MILAIILTLILLAMLSVIIVLFTLLVKEQEKVHKQYLQISTLLGEIEYNNSLAAGHITKRTNN